MRWPLTRLALTLVVALVALPAATSAQTPALTILHFNDDYQLTAVDGGKAGGLDRLAAVVNEHRARDRHALLLFAGDLISPSVESSVFKGAQLIAGLNQLRVDAAVLGNHEFDYGPEELVKRIAESRFPWLGANVFGGPGGRPFPGTRPWVLLYPGGVPVGIFGLLTPETAVSSSPGATTFADPVVAARVIVPFLKRAGAQVVIALTHQFVHDDQRLLEAVPDIDLVIGGHEHDPLTARVGNRLIAKAGSDARWLGVTRFPLDGSTRATHELITITDRTPSDPEMAALIKRYSDQLSAQLDVVVGRTTVELDARNTTVRAREAALGNFIADAWRAAMRTDVAIANGGSIRTNALFPAGPIRRRDVIAWLPFGNTVTAIRIRGAVLRAALENGVSQVENLSGRFPQVSGLRFTFNPTRPAGQRVLEVQVGGRPLDDNALYTVAVTNFLLGGGDGYAMLRQGDVLVDPAGGPLEVNVVTDAIQRAGAISPRVEGRITVVR